PGTQAGWKTKPTVVVSETSFCRAALPPVVTRAGEKFFAVSWNVARRAAGLAPTGAPPALPVPNSGLAVNSARQFCARTVGLVPALMLRTSQGSSMPPARFVEEGAKSWKRVGA